MGKVKVAIFVLCWAIIPVSIALGAELIVPTRYPTIQAAVDQAIKDDTVIVEDDTYTGPGNRDIELKGKAITIRSRNGYQKCIIDCRGTAEDPHRGFYQHRGERGVVISGFTITNGYADKGGGIYCSGRPTISNNLITGNTATDGGGIYCYERGKIVSNTISGNRARRGGGIFTWEDFAPTIMDNIISHNRAEVEGGGVAAHDNAPPFIGNLIFRNTTAGRGGGIYLQSAPSVLTNNTIAWNTATLAGGICAYHGSAPITVSNSIIWGNSSTTGPQQILAGGSSMILSYSCYPAGSGEIDGAVRPRKGCLHRNPDFRDATRGDYHLKKTSPCINAGNNSYWENSFISQDLDGRRRVTGGTIDMGVYEFPGPAR